MAKTRAEIRAMTPSRIPLMRMPRDFLIILLLMLEMKDCANLDSAMSETKGRKLFLSLLDSGNIWFEGSKDALDYIRSNRLVWLGKRGIGLSSLSCTPRIGWNGPIDVTADMVVAVIKNSRALKKLYLQGWFRGLTKVHMKSIANHCCQVETLDFTQCGDGLRESVLAIAVTCMQKLNTITLHRCYRITDASLMIISANCPRLTSADFSECNSITDNGIVSLIQGCPLIEELKLNLIQGITDVSIRTIANGCPSIKILQLMSCSHITDASITLLAKQCTRLQALDLENCDRLTNTSITHLGCHCPCLTELNIANCRRINDDGFISFIRARGSGLKSLNIGGCRLLTDHSVASIAGYCPSLTKVILDSNQNITDASVMLLAEGCRDLNYVSLIECNSIIDLSLDKLGESCPKLENVYLWFSYNLSQEGKERLRQRIPNIKIHG